MPIRRLIVLVCGIALLATSVALSPPASAASSANVIADCNAHNTLTHNYSIAQLENALRTMPADVSEYTSCKDVITRELLIQQGKLKGGGGAAGGSGSGGSSFLPTPVIVVLVVLLLAAATLGALAIRRRRESGDGASQPPSTSS